MTQLAESDPQVYQQIGYDELVTYAIYSLTLAGKEATFENIVAEAFTLFPRRFSLRGYPQWPDAAVVNKSWLRCRTDKGYIVGSVKEGFRLTPKGVSVAEKVGKVLKGVASVPTRGIEIKSEIRTKAGRLLRALEESAAFKEYRETGSLETLSEYGFTDMLLLMPDSSSSSIRSNLEQFKQAAELYERQDILDFLRSCEKRFRAKLNSKSLHNIHRLRST